MSIIVALGLGAIQLTPAMEQPPKTSPQQLILGGSSAEWYRRETSVQPPIYDLVKVVTYNKSNGIILTVQQGWRGNVWWAITAPGQSNTDEWLSMNRLAHQPPSRPHYTVFANNNNIYTVDFEKMEAWKQTAPYFKALLQRVKPSPHLQQMINAALQKTNTEINQLGNINTQEKGQQVINIVKTNVLPTVMHISDVAGQTERTKIQELDDIIRGSELSLTVEENTARLNKDK